ncbi:LysR family transcriptional regulator [Psychromonas sp. B3M02]|uniref:LysR family transcriptional regulator n=1 Tax=Psychromonas sp. B3M02 TaxID=2267226 RepID=UPI000DE84D85|nr:LysR family transcriptional regulator [Psychromonas sp. B3M02]RBW46377.1 LysR family transcriptional regulator [Psychromonas sp. B3M02]
MDKLDMMKAFITVSKEGSFTKAADKLDISNQLVSKYIAHLEDHLGVRLFNRTTRKIRLTAEGEQCVQHVQQILENIQDMEGNLGQFKNEVQGTLRISAPVSFATKHIAPLLRDFRRKNPAVKIDLQLNDRKTDVVEEGFDLALRISELKSSSLIAKRIAPIHIVTCASPEYLEKNGIPEHPDQLNPDHFLHYNYMDYNRTHLPIINALRHSIKAQRQSISSNNGDVLVEAAVAGEGYVVQPTFIVSEAVKQGKLKVILEDFAPDVMSLYVVYPHRKLTSNKLTAFIDFISHYYGEQPYWDDYQA